MLKIKSSLILSFLFSQALQAQSVRDTVFNDVILVKKENVTATANNFIIHLPIQVSEKTIIIYNADERIPNEFFFNRQTFLYPQNEIILVTLDWAYFAAIRETQLSTTSCLRPLRQIRLYHINRSTQKIDSLLADEMDPERMLKFNFAQLVPPAEDFSLTGRWRVTGHQGACGVSDSVTMTEKAFMLIFEKEYIVRNFRESIGNFTLRGDSLNFNLGSSSFYYRIFPDAINKRRMTLVPVSDTYAYRGDESCAIQYERFDTAGRKIHGVVLNEENKVIPGAQVMIKGRKEFTTTDKDGKFEIEAQQYDILDIRACCGEYRSLMMVVTDKNSYSIQLPGAIQEIKSTKKSKGKKHSN